MLSPEVTVIADGGGVVSAATRPVVGVDHVSRFLLGIVQKYAKAVDDGMAIRIEIAPIAVNGAPAIIAYADDKVLYVYTLDMDEDGKILTIFGMANPEKLDGVRALENEAS
jgi:RNA polymerase sigma-70 factor (ECF subfamily)